MYFECAWASQHLEPSASMSTVGKRGFRRVLFFVGNFCARQWSGKWTLEAWSYGFKGQTAGMEESTGPNHGLSFRFGGIQRTKRNIKTRNHWAVGATPKGKAKPRSPGDSADVFEGGNSFFWKLWLEELLMVASRWCNHFQWHRDWNLFGPIGFFAIFCVVWGAWKPWALEMVVSTGTGRSKMRGPLRRRRHSHTRSEHRL